MRQLIQIASKHVIQLGKPLQVSKAYKQIENAYDECLPYWLWYHIVGSTANPTHLHGDIALRISHMGTPEI